MPLIYDRAHPTGAPHPKPHPHPHPKPNRRPNPKPKPNANANPGKRHKLQKRLCIPSFEQGRSMASFLVAVQEEADVLSREWRARAGTDGKVTSPTSPTYLAYISPTSRHISPKSPCISQVSLDCYAEMRRLTLAVILRVTFGLGEIKGRYS